MASTLSVPVCPQLLFRHTLHGLVVAFFVDDKIHGDDACGQAKAQDTIVISTPATRWFSSDFFSHKRVKKGSDHAGAGMDAPAKADDGHPKADTGKLRLQHLFHAVHAAENDDDKTQHQYYQGESSSLNRELNAAHCCGFRPGTISIVSECFK